MNDNRQNLAAKKDYGSLAVPVVLVVVLLLIGWIIFSLAQPAALPTPVSGATLSATSTDMPSSTPALPVPIQTYIATPSTTLLMTGSSNLTPTSTSTPTSTLTPTPSPCPTAPPRTTTATWTVTPTDTPTQAPTNTITVTITVTTTSIVTATLAPTTVTPTITPTLTNTPIITPICVVNPPNGWILYVVQKGETLFSLSRNSGAATDDVVAYNCIQNTNLSEGQKIYLPGQPNTPTPTFFPTNSEMPELLGPENDSTVNTDVTFEWSWGHNLQKGEYYVLIISCTCQSQIEYKWTEKTSVNDLSWRSGQIHWRVVVAHPRTSNPNQVQEEPIDLVSSYSSEHVFYWYPRDKPAPTPTFTLYPTPTPTRIIVTPEPTSTPKKNP